MLLNDLQIFHAIESGSIAVTNYELENPPFEKNAQIQPASFDLTVGEIWVPPEDSNNSDNLLPAQSGLVLLPGRACVVVTNEKLTLAGEIAGFGFPPAHISVQGLLMTNPGHVDPGYSGHMHFALINMGKRPFTLRNGTPIVSLMFYKLTKPANDDFLARRGGSVTPADPAAMVTALTHDFLEVETRAAQIAESVTEKEMTVANTNIEAAKLNISKWQVWAPMVGSALLAVVALISGLVTGPSSEELAKLENRVIKLEVPSTVAGFDGELEKLRNRIRQLERGQK